MLPHRLFGSPNSAYFTFKMFLKSPKVYTIRGEFPLFNVYILCESGVTTLSQELVRVKSPRK